MNRRINLNHLPGAFTYFPTMQIVQAESKSTFLTNMPAWAPSTGRFLLLVWVAKRWFLSHFRGHKCNAPNLGRRVHPCNYNNLVLSRVEWWSCVMNLSCRKSARRRIILIVQREGGVCTYSNAYNHKTVGRLSNKVIVLHMYTAAVFAIDFS